MALSTAAPPASAQQALPVNLQPRKQGLTWAGHRLDKQLLEARVAAVGGQRDG